MEVDDRMKEGLARERSYLFDNIKALLILLVVIGHMLSRGGVIETKSSTLYYFIYLFHMPAFVFVSGYFSKNVEKCRDTAVQRFLIPYVVFTILLYLQKLALYWNSGEDMTFSIMRPSWGMWYFLALFAWKLLLKDIVMFRFVLPGSFFLGLGCGLSREFGYYLSIGRICSLLFFFLLGYYCKEETIRKIRKIPKIASLVIVAMTSVIAYACIHVLHMDTEVLFMRFPYGEESEASQLLLRLLVYVVAVLMIVVIINLMPDKKQWFGYIGRNSISVYVLHLFLLKAVERYGWFTNDVILYVITTVVSSILICVVFALPQVKRCYDFCIQIIIQSLIKKDKRA